MLFRQALASVLAADDVDDVVDLAALEHDGRHYDTAVISPGTCVPDADVVIVLPPNGAGEVTITCAGRTERVDIESVAALFDVLDAYAPAAQPRRRPE